MFAAEHSATAFATFQFGTDAPPGHWKHRGGRCRQATSKAALLEAAKRVRIDVVSGTQLDAVDAQASTWPWYWILLAALGATIAAISMVVGAVFFTRKLRRRRVGRGQYRRTSSQVVPTSSQAAIGVKP